MNTLRKVWLPIAILGMANMAWAATDTTTLDISINVQPACTLDSIDAVSTTHATGASGTQAQSGNVKVTCNSGTTYTIAMGAGGYAAGTQRRVNNGANYMNYDLFRSGGTTAWGSAGTTADNSMESAADWNSIGTGSQQNFGYQVAYTLAGTEAAGTYIDTVLVTVEF